MNSLLAVAPSGIEAILILSNRRLPNDEARAKLVAEVRDSLKLTEAQLSWKGRDDLASGQLMLASINTKDGHWQAVSEMLTRVLDEPVVAVNADEDMWERLEAWAVLNHLQRTIDSLLMILAQRALKDKA